MDSWLLCFYCFSNVLLLLVFCKCFVALPRGAMGWSALCDVVFPDHTHFFQCVPKSYICRPPCSHTYSLEVELISVVEQDDLSLVANLEDRSPCDEAHFISCTFPHIFHARIQKVLSEGSNFDNVF